ncbi:phosphatidate cytidylyltransferase [Candidatus Curculioniphilus buchneri]|uniref:phosphatidate cytidylyltransferase n=1 Tax=Candidatus Curculioniphilus buchneri TaxID=690594 RepID=UPI00376EC3DE
MLKHRLITTFILVPIVISTLFMLPFITFALITLLVCILGVWEWGKLISLISIKQRIWLTVFCGFLQAQIILVILDCHSIISIWQVRCALWSAFFWWITATLLVCTYPHSAVLWNKSKLQQIAFCMLTIIPFFYGVLALRQHNYNINYFTGSWWLLYVMTLVWAVDSGAYFFGQLLGNHKMVPSLSPKKTWEGFIGGLVTSAIIAWLFNKYAPLNISPVTLLTCSIVASLAAVLGDLTESMFKREVGIKNTSHLIPGHGGILDRIDSLTAAVPVFTFLILLIFNTI